MELKQIIIFLNVGKKAILSTAIGFGVLGLVLFFALPQTHTAVGSFYVSREIDAIRRSEFTYEGYYAQQAAANSTDAAVGIFKSVDIQRKTLEEMQIPVTKTNLGKLDRSMRVKKISPQLLTLTVKGNSNAEADGVWNSLALNSISAFEDLSLRGDPNMNITLVGESPVVYETSNSLLFNVAAGFLLGSLISTTLIIFKEYFK